MNDSSSGHDGDPRPCEETFVFGDYELRKDMRICPDCGEIKGFLRYAGSGPFKKQECSCRKNEAWPERREDFRRYFNLDFSSAVTLCAGCGQPLIPNGSKFSPFFCKNCQEFVVAFNRYKRHVEIPLGRHSAMNGLFLSGQDIKKPEVISFFARSSSLLVDRMEIIAEWKKIIIGDNFRRLGKPDWDMDLYQYLIAMPKDWFSSYLAFLGFRKFFLKERKEGLEIPIPEASANENSESDAIEEPLGQYVQDKAISCSFYTLVARSQAIDERWPGGVKSYLSRYGVVYNDNLIATYLMGLEFEDQLVELAEYSLEPFKDFALFDAGDAIFMADGTPFDTGVSWLGGYYQNHKVNVYLKQ